MRRTSTALALGLVVLAGGCSSTPPAEPMVRAKDRNLDAGTRNEAIDEIWANGLAGGSREATRESLKNLVWSPSQPATVRTHAIEVLLNDQADVGQADTRKMLRLLLHTETNPEMVTEIGNIAAQRGWTDFTGPLVRQLAKRDFSVDEEQRRARGPLMALHPGKAIEQIAFDVMMTPVTSTGLDAERDQRARDASWELLARLDKDGTQRRAMLATVTPGSDKTLQDLRACSDELRCIPLTASQLSWLRRMREGKNTAWWNACAAGVAQLSSDQQRGLMLRHMEPIRWAAANRASWLGQSKDALAAELAARIKPRRTHYRSGGSGVSGDTSLANEDLPTNLPLMSWGDVLAALVVDETLRAKPLGEVLWKQIERDMQDTSTEHGGLMSITADGSLTPAIYPPRASQRFGDSRFVASDDLISSATTALAHYHFHAQRVDSAQYAGPGPGDMEFALDQGLNCLVITPVRDGIMDVDFYCAPSVKVDLGELKR